MTLNPKIELVTPFQVNTVRCVYLANRHVLSEQNIIIDVRG